MSKWEWSRDDPRGKTVVLKTSTLEHILGDHTEADAEGRMFALEAAPEIIEAPRFIIEDTSSCGEERKREKYFDTRYHEPTGKFSYVVVIVDTDRDPYEVVTCTRQRKMSDTISKEGLLYDSSKPCKREG